MQNFSETLKGFVGRHFMAIVMWWLLALIGILLFSDFSKSPTTITSEKIDPYVLSTKGKTLILREKQLLTIEENHSGSILVNDKVKTLNSTATIFWPDGSITRLAEQSSIKVNQMQASTANENIQVDFSLEQGKSWSNVIRYYFGSSYFHERFNNDTALAAVRWTVFEVNLDHKYIHTIDHAVSIEDIGSHTGSTFVVAGGILDTDTRRVLLQDKLDTAWNELNTNADIIYLNAKLEALKQTILQSAGQKNYLDIVLQKLGIATEKPSLEVLLSGDPAALNQFGEAVKKGNNSKELLDIYQQFYGLENTQTVLSAKMKLRDLIIETAPAEQKNTFLTDFARSTLYDSWNKLQLGTGSIDWLEQKLQEYLKQGADKDLINSLRNASKQEGVINLSNSVEDIKNTVIETLGKENLLDTVTKSVTTENIEKVNNAADSVRSGFMDWLKNLFNK